jgi:hypothetical protein
MTRKPGADNSKRNHNDKSHVFPALDTARLDDTVAVDSEPFEAFEQWLDRELVKLVARWSPFAAPNATLPTNAVGNGRSRRLQSVKS